MKVLSCLIFSLLATTGFAQFKRGTVMAGGSFSMNRMTEKSDYNNVTTTEAIITSIDITPAAGYFIMNNFALGLAVDYNHTSSKIPGSTTGKDHSYVFSPFARYYVNRFFGQATAGFGKEEESQGKISQASVGVGYVILITENVAIEPLLGYSHSAEKFSNFSLTDTTNKFYLQVGLQFYLNR